MQPQFSYLIPTSEQRQSSLRNQSPSQGKIQRNSIQSNRFQPANAYQADQDNQSFTNDQRPTLTYNQVYDVNLPHFNRENQVPARVLSPQQSQGNYNNNNQPELYSQNRKHHQNQNAWQPEQHNSQYQEYLPPRMEAPQYAEQDYEFSGKNPKQRGGQSPDIRVSVKKENKTPFQKARESRMRNRSRASRGSRASNGNNEEDYPKVISPVMRDTRDKTPEGVAKPSAIPKSIIHPDPLEVLKIQDFLNKQFEEKVKSINDEVLQKMQYVQAEHQAVLEQTHLMYIKKKEQEAAAQNYDELNKHLLVNDSFNQRPVYNNSYVHQETYKPVVRISAAPPQLHRQSSRGRNWDADSQSRGDRDYSNNTIQMLGDSEYESGRDSRVSLVQPTTTVFTDLDNSHYSTIMNQERNPEVLRDFYKEFCDAVRKTRQIKQDGEEVSIHDLLVQLKMLGDDNSEIIMQNEGVEYQAYTSEILRQQSKKFVILIRGGQSQQAKNDDVVKNLFKILCGIMNFRLKQRGFNPLAKEALQSYMDSINFELEDSDLILSNQMATIRLLSNRQAFSLSDQQLSVIHKKYKNLYAQRMRSIQNVEKLPKELQYQELEESREYRDEFKPIERLNMRENSFIGRGSHYANSRSPARAGRKDERDVSPKKSMIQDFLNMMPSPKIGRKNESPIRERKRGQVEENMKKRPDMEHGGYNL